MRSSVPRILSAERAVRLHYIVIDAHDLPGPAPVLDACARLEGPVRARQRDPHRDRRERTGRHMLHAGHRSQDGQEPRASRPHPAAQRTAIRRSNAFSRSGHAESTSGRPVLSPGLSLPTRRETSPASCARRKRSSAKAWHREPQTDPVPARGFVVAECDVRLGGRGPMTVRSLTARIWAGVQRARLRPSRFRYSRRGRAQAERDGQSEGARPGPLAVRAGGLPLPGGPFAPVRRCR
jgi:hypothetical protein